MFGSLLGPLPVRQGPPARPDHSDLSQITDAQMQLMLLEQQEGKRKRMMAQEYEQIQSAKEAPAEKSQHIGTDTTDSMSRVDRGEPDWAKDPSQRERPTQDLHWEPDTELDMYPDAVSVRREFVSGLDPFTNPFHILPWLLADEDYSPHHLAKDQRNDNGETTTPSRLSSHPWHEAFEDLRLSQNGETIRDSSSWPDMWPTATATVKEILTPQPIRNFSEDRQQHNGSMRSEKEPHRDSQHAPLATIIAQAVQSVDKAAEQAVLSFLEAFRGDAKSAAIGQHNEVASGDQRPSVVSTMTRTETRTLPDGSRETRRVLKRRFADGSEEHEETIDTNPARRTRSSFIEESSVPPNSTSTDKQTQTAIQAPIREGRPSAVPRENQTTGGGWFWR